MKPSAQPAPPPVSISPDRSLAWWRRLVPLIAARRWRFLSFIALSFAGLVVQVLVPDLLNRAVTAAQAGGSVLVYVEAILGCAVVAGAAGYFARTWQLQLVYDVESDLRRLTYRHLVGLSASYYDRMQTGELISRANSDVRVLQLFLSFAPQVAVQLGIAVVAFVLMLTISVPLAFVTIATLPLTLLLGLSMRRRMWPVSWFIQSRLAEVTNIVDENVNGTRVVKAFAAEQPQYTALAAAADSVRRAYLREAGLRARWAPLVQNLPNLATVVVLALGGWLVIHSGLEIGAILAFATYLVILQAPFMMLGFVLMMAQRASASAERVLEILDAPVAVTDRPGAGELVTSRGEVRFRGVSFAYPTQPGRPANPLVLDGLDLILPGGSVTALVGPTGSGKSTVARLLSRFYDVDAGSVSIDGIDVRDVTQDSLRRAVGVVFDEPFLFSVPVVENIGYGRAQGRDVAEVEPADVRIAARAASADAFISELPEGYSTVLGERGFTLSGGQRQRVGIARTLLQNPPVLVLDDATSAIDVSTERRIHDALEELMQHRTTLVIAHRLSTISLADRVVLLDEGRVVATGTHEELLAGSERYRQVLATLPEGVPAGEMA